jgi:glycogen(starch) synthase
MYIESLVGLNELLKQQNSKLTVVAFIIMPAKTNNFNVESLKGHSFIRDMRKTVGSIVESVSERMFDAIAQGQVGDCITQKSKSC